MLRLMTVLAVAQLGPGIQGALADDQNASAGDIAIEGVAATPAKAGEATRVTFIIENRGSERANVTGLRLATGEPSRVLGFLGTSHSAPIGAISVGPGERYRLDGRTAWIDVGPLKSDLRVGAVVPAALLMGRFETPVDVHVTATTSTGAPVPATASQPLGKR